MKHRESRKEKRKYGSQSISLKYKAEKSKKREPPGELPNSDMLQLLGIIPDYA